MKREQTNCALCGMLFTGAVQPDVVTVGRAKVHVCPDAHECRRRAIELLRAYEKLTGRRPERV